jgi:two-component system LytT family sensor kinase
MIYFTYMKKLLLQVLFWSFFFLAWQRVVYFYIANPEVRLLFTSFDVSLVIITFYSIYSLVTPRLFFRKNKLFFFAGLSGTIILAILLMGGIARGFLNHDIIPIRFGMLWSSDDMLHNFYFIAMLGALAGLITRLSMHWLHSERKMKEIEQNRLSTELMYLRMQTNPHFLFNAINTIYVQIDEAKENAKVTLSMFSGMLRYQLFECNGDKVSIEKEIDYIKNYVYLQSLRKDETYRIDFRYVGDLVGFEIAPFILIPFIENMFKHVSGDLGLNSIRCELTGSDRELEFFGVNTKSQTTNTKKPGGIGLANAKRRLELIYPGKFSLDIEDNDLIYKVCLKIQLV